MSLKDNVFYFEKLNHSDNIIHVQNGIRTVLQIFGTTGYEYTKEITLFDHYFRHLYRILKFIHESGIKEFEDGYRYTSILRATLSPYELVWIFYNCLAEYGSKKFKPLIEEYSLLKNIRFNLLTETADFPEEYIQNEGQSTDEYLYKYYFTKIKENPKKYYLQAYNKKDSDELKKALIAIE